MRYEIHEANNQAGFYFTEVADNGQVVTTSEVYTRKADARRAIVSASHTGDRIIDKTYTE